MVVGLKLNRNKQDEIIAKQYKKLRYKKEFVVSKILQILSFMIVILNTLVIILGIIFNEYLGDIESLLLVLVSITTLSIILSIILGVANLHVRIKAEEKFLNIYRYCIYSIEVQDNQIKLNQNIRVKTVKTNNDTCNNLYKNRYIQYLLNVDDIDVIEIDNNKDIITIYCTYAKNCYTNENRQKLLETGKYTEDRIQIVRCIHCIEEFLYRISNEYNIEISETN